jgi:hypothetical protein
MPKSSAVSVVRAASDFLQIALERAFEAERIGHHIDRTQRHGRLGDERVQKAQNRPRHGEDIVTDGPEEVLPDFAVRRVGEQQRLGPWSGECVAGARAACFPSFSSSLGRARCLRICPKLQAVKE